MALSAKLGKLEEWNDRRRAIAGTYRRELADAPVYMYKVHPDAVHVYHQFVIAVSDRDKVAFSLKEHDIPTLIHYPTPCHQLPAFKQFATASLPAAEWMAGHHLSLPMSPHLTDGEINLVCEKLKEVLKGEQKPEPISG